MYYFIVNPKSKSGAGIHVWQEVQEVLEKQETEYRCFFTRHPHHATALAREITSKPGKKTLVVLGGDGTVNEVLNGIEHPASVTLGYIPTGSGNDFARALKLPAAPLEAVSNLLNPSYFGYLDLPAAFVNGEKRLFAVSCGMGYDAAICLEAFRSKLKTVLNKINMGKLAYAGIGVKQLLLCKPRPVTLILDEQKTVYFQKAYFVTAMNTCYEGGGLKFCPAARPDDGLLDICVFADLSRLKFLLLLAASFPGVHPGFKGASIYTCKKARISSPISLPVHADGENLGFQKELTVSCTEERLRIIAGKTGF